MAKLSEFLSSHSRVCALLYTDGDDQSMQMIQIFKHVPADFPDLAFTTCQDLTEVGPFFPSGSFDIPAVAFFENGGKCGLLKSCNPQALLSSLTAWVGEGRRGLQVYLSDVKEGNERQRNEKRDTLGKELEKRLYDLIHRSTVMVFMKGAKENPFCRFSKQLVAIFEKKGILFDSFDIFNDNEVREGLKIYSDWPTFPQVYIKGEFIGGVDIIKGMDEDGSLLSLIPSENLKTPQ